GSLTTSTAPDSILITVGYSLQIQAWVVPLDSGTTFSWSPEEHLECTQCLHPFAKPDSTVWFVFTAISAYGCIASDSVLVMVYHPCPELFVPTVFSPNNDGLNDELCVRGGCIQEFAFTIWDRWNAEVFHTVDIGRCWDGTYRGQPLSGGAFRYLLNVVHTDGTAVEQAGEILIKR
ncbi:MAG: gliding motility-associated C-terminal domain-containing protein, partial [Flavobacteriales bacterium]